MPLSYRRKKPYRGRRRRTTKSRAMTVGRVKRIISAELKHKNQNIGFTNIFVGSQSIVHLSDIAQGDVANQRNGNWIQPITYHGYVTIKGFDAAAAESYGVRVGIARWNNDESADPITLGKVMFDAAIPASNFSYINKGAFKILWSRYVNVVNSQINPQFLKTLRFKVSLGRSPKTLYHVAVFKKYQLFFFAMSDDLSVAEHPSYTLDSTLRYTDS